MALDFFSVADKFLKSVLWVGLHSEIKYDRRFESIPIWVTGTVLLVVFCTVASIANALLWIVPYKDPLKCFRKPIVVYITALAL